LILASSLEGPTVVSRLKVLTAISVLLSRRVDAPQSACS
jgi:hypothetical protein